MSSPAKRLYKFEGFRLDPAERLLVRDGATIPLAPKAFEMLVVLVSQSGRLVTKGELLKTVWDGAAVEENNLDKTISVLRKALGQSGAERKLIETVRGHGYRFNAEVTEITTAPGNGSTPLSNASELVPEAPAAFDATPQLMHPPVPIILEQRGWRLSLWLVALLISGIAALWLWPTRARQPELPREINVTRLTNGGNIHHAVLSPNGRYFAYTEQDGAITQLCLRQTEGGQPAVLVPELGLVIQGLTFAPDGQDIYFVTADEANPQGALYRVPALGGAVTKILTGISSPVSFAPTGERIAFIRMAGAGDLLESSLMLADLTGGNERVVLTRHGLENFGEDGLSWSPDGMEIACQLWSGPTKTSDRFCRLAGVDVKSGVSRWLSSQQWDNCGRGAWLRDGSGIVMIGTKQGESNTTARDAIWLIAQPEGTLRRITADLNRHFYRALSVTDDGSTMLVIPFNRTSQIWSVASSRPGQGKQLGYDAKSAIQLTTGTGEGRAGLVSVDNGSVVYVGRTGDHVDLWRMKSDGSQQQQLTTDPPFLEEVRAPLNGRYLVFASPRAGRSHLFRVAYNGSTLQQLTSGESYEIDSDCSPDGRWIVYASHSLQPGKVPESHLYRIPAEGGTPVKLTEHPARSPHFSPDGKWISYVYPTALYWQVAVIAAEGGAPIKVFNLPTWAEPALGCLWTPDSQSLTYLANEKNSGNLWLQPLDGSAPRALTDFNSGEIYNYAFSRDSQQIFLARGYSIHDVSLLRNFR